MPTPRAPRELKKPPTIRAMKIAAQLKAKNPKNPEIYAKEVPAIKPAVLVADTDEEMKD